MWRSGLPNVSQRYLKLESTISRQRSPITSQGIISTFLGPKYVLPSRLQLQIMTPILRSFPSRRPFFVKLFDLGSQILSMSCQSYAMGLNQSRPTNINGYDFSALEGRPSRLASKAVVREFAIAWNLPQAVITNMNEPKIRNFDDVAASVESLILLIGAVYLVHGQTQVMEFVKNRIIHGRSGLYMINMRQMNF